MEYGIYTDRYSFLFASYFTNYVVLYCPNMEWIWLARHRNGLIFHKVGNGMANEGVALCLFIYFFLLFLYNVTTKTIERYILYFVVWSTGILFDLIWYNLVLFKVNRSTMKIFYISITDIDKKQYNFIMWLFLWNISWNKMNRQEFWMV